MEHRFFRRETNILPFKFSRTLPKIHVSPKCLTRFYVFKKLHRYNEVFTYGKLFFSRKWGTIFHVKKHRWDSEIVLSFNLIGHLQNAPMVPVALCALVFLPISGLCRLGKKKKIKVLSGRRGGFFLNVYIFKRF